MTLKAGWLDRQFERVNEEIREWPTWMRREAGFDRGVYEKEEMDRKNPEESSTP